MKLIVESGATKSTWVLLDQGVIVDRQILKGINPTTNPSSLAVIEGYTSPHINAIQSIYYYGAGVSASEAHAALISNLSEYFNIQSIYIERDSLAACRSVSEGKASIVSILGTGMNVVVYDGNEINHSCKSLGYLFGDEGSGYYIGKLILQAYFNGKMVATDAKAFESAYLTDQQDLIFKIYNSARPNYETAQLTRFLSSSTRVFKKDILHKAFNHFFENQIVTIDNHQAYTLNFVGSISQIFEAELRAVAADYKLIIDKIVGDPIDGLVNFHRNKI